MEEIWKDIEGYEGVYQVSNLGNIKSKKRRGAWKERILKPVKTRDNYLIVTLSKNSKSITKRVHRLVAEAFIDNPNKYPEVNHIDGNKQNNNVENLEWVTVQQNQLHAWKIGLKTSEGMAKNLGAYSKKGIENPKSLQVMMLDKNTGKIIKIYESTREAERKTGITAQNISAVCRKRYGHKTAGGYIWKYSEVVL